jgi:hypothetical protein
MGPETLRLLHCHDMLFSDSCSYPADGRPPRRSALNVDGTPVQLGLTLGGRRGSRLQFLGEVGAAGWSNDQRLVAARDRLRRLVRLVGAERSLAQLEMLADELLPAADRELLAEHAGAMWLGAEFVPGGRPQAKLYCNARWGAESGRWQRLERLATRLGAAADWRKLRALEDDGLEPLGAALGATGDGGLAGRVYLNGYGIGWDRLAVLGTRFAGAKFAENLAQFGTVLLGDQSRWPARSVVCSFAIGTGRLGDVKVELCAHCAFDSDVDVQRRCVNWLGTGQGEVYSKAVAVIAPLGLNGTAVTLHSHVGVSSRDEQTFYFNPRPPASGADAG